MYKSSMTSGHFASYNIYTKCYTTFIVSLVTCWYVAIVTKQHNTGISNQRLKVLHASLLHGPCLEGYCMDRVWKVTANGAM